MLIWRCTGVTGMDEKRCPEQNNIHDKFCGACGSARPKDVVLPPSILEQRMKLPATDKEDDDDDDESPAKPSKRRAPPATVCK